jgi:hypothetical protein
MISTPTSASISCPPFIETPRNLGDLSDNAFQEEAVVVLPLLPSIDAMFQCLDGSKPGLEPPSQLSALPNHREDGYKIGGGNCDG